MANPQKENGFTPISHEILEALCRYNFNGCEYALILLIIRKTYGYQKKADIISISQFVKYTNYSKRQVITSLSRLKINYVIKEVQKTALGNKYFFNKNYEEWRGVQKTAPVQSTAKSSAVFGKKGVLNTAHTIDNLQKKTKESTFKNQKALNQLREKLKGIVYEKI